MNEEGAEVETEVFKKPFMVHIPAGMRHCPLRTQKEAGHVTLGIRPYDRRVR